MKTSKTRLILLYSFLLSISAPTLYAAATDQPPKDRISLVAAQAIALKTYPDGQVESHELEFEMKAWVYSFDLKNKEGQIHEILVDAKTGKVLSHVTETITEVQKEALEDKKGAH